MSDEDIQALASLIEHRTLHAFQELEVLVMSALDDLTTAINNLTAAVDADIAAHQAATGGITEQQAADAAAQVQAQADKLAAANTPTP